MNHNSRAYTAGSITGGIVGAGLGFGAAGAVGSAGRLAAIARRYESLSTAVDVGKATYNVLSGSGSFSDALAFVPVVGGSAKRLNGFAARAGGAVTGGCFVPGTPVRLCAEPAMTSAGGNVETTKTTANAAPTTTTIAIENVALGARVPDQNPRPEDYDFSLGSFDASTWKKISLAFHRKDGRLVEVELLRPGWWIAYFEIESGKSFALSFGEMNAMGTAIVNSVEDIEPVAEGDGSVVTGRFVTRGVSNLVRVQLEDGTSFEGTDTHPVWVVNQQAWVSLGELTDGNLLDTVLGSVAVEAVTKLRQIQDVYNIEVQGHHVYRVSECGVLVHNVCPDDIVTEISGIPLRTAPKRVTTPPDPAFPPGSMGAAKAWSLRSRYRAANLPNQGRIRYVPPENYNPSTPFPRGPQHGYLDRFDNEWVWDPVKGE